MLLWLVVAYLAVSIGIGVYAATRVHDARDYIVAGRNLPFIFVLAMVFATWFGAETVLGISATFIQEGARGLISDPLRRSVSSSSGFSSPDLCIGKICSRSVISFARATTARSRWFFRCASSCPTSAG